jgi:hypothetical protein
VAGSVVGGVLRGVLLGGRQLPLGAVLIELHERYDIVALGLANESTQPSSLAM